MPYLDKQSREEMDLGEPPANAGELTYCLTRQIQAYLKERAEDGMRYENLAVVLGAIEGAKLDFIDRIVLPYEKKKREENGDVWT